MKGADIGQLLAGAAAVFVAIWGIVTFVSARRGKQDSNRITERFNEFQIMEGTIDTLRISLGEAQKETTELRLDLANARLETNKLRDELTSALANVAILSDHIRQHAPDVPFPQLRRVRNGSL